MDSALRSSLVEFLASLPLLQNEAGRRALLLSSGIETLPSDLSAEGSVSEFARALIDDLDREKISSDKKPILLNVLWHLMTLVKAEQQPVLQELYNEYLKSIELADQTLPQKQEPQQPSSNSAKRDITAHKHYFEQVTGHSQVISESTIINIIAQASQANLSPALLKQLQELLPQANQPSLQQEFHSLRRSFRDIAKKHRIWMNAREWLEQHKEMLVEKGIRDVLTTHPYYADDLNTEDAHQKIGEHLEWILTCLRVRDAEKISFEDHIREFTPHRSLYDAYHAVFTSIKAQIMAEIAQSTQHLSEAAGKDLVQFLNFLIAQY